MVGIWVKKECQVSFPDYSTLVLQFSHRKQSKTLYSFHRTFINHLLVKNQSTIKCFAFVADYATSMGYALTREAKVNEA